MLHLKIDGRRIFGSPALKINLPTPGEIMYTILISEFQESYMEREFNYTGTCIPGKHYMVDTSRQIAQIMQLIGEEVYFTINRPRQYGKTTTLLLLELELL